MVKYLDGLIKTWDGGRKAEREYVLSEIAGMEPLIAAYFGVRFAQHFSDDASHTNVLASMIEREI